MKYFDAHSHLYLSAFDADRDAVLARMRDGGVGSVVIGTNLAESKQALALAQQYDFLWASVGLHPNEAEAFDAVAFEELARDPKVVAVGECGLDYFRSSGEGQKEKFEAQIALAEKVGKPLIIHCRDAHDDCISVLQNTAIAAKVPVVMHFFTGSGELAQRYLDLGCYLSFPGPITYTSMYDDSIRVCPVERMLAETDSPFAAPVPNRGKRNEPSFVSGVVEKLATIKGMTPDDIAAHTVANAKKIFALSLVLALVVGPAPVFAQTEVPYAYPDVPAVSLQSITYVASGPTALDVFFGASETLTANAVAGTAGLWSQAKAWFDAW